jgi:hemin uptake protein HemP
MMTKQQPASAQRVVVLAKTSPTHQRVSSFALLGEATRLVIEHAGEEYPLRITSKGKLILTK